MAALQTERKRAKGVDPRVVQAIAGELGETADVTRATCRRGAPARKVAVTAGWRGQSAPDTR
jgi:hypothetical protein